MTLSFERPAFLQREGPRWFNIPAPRPFAQDLARGLHEALAPFGPEALSQAIVLTPTRRGARALADAFVGAADGRAVLPPQMRPLGDLDEGEPPFEPGDLALDLPAAIAPLQRRFELTRTVMENAHLLPGRDLTASSALEMADALGSFLDSLQIEEIEAGERLAGLVEADLAEHWRVSRDFLDAALVQWPRRLAALGVVDVSERRVRLLRRLAQVWSDHPPQGVLVAAGSTGTAPATAALLQVIAQAPQGCVVLPGLDESLSEEAWLDVGEQHPQGAMKRLLDGAEFDRKDVEVWPASRPTSAHGRWRQRVINEALRPPERTADWLRIIGELNARGDAEAPDGIAFGLSGLSLVSARSEDEAATVAALLLREALETPGRTAALVAPDQTLARRVAAKLARWGVVPDSSAGEALAGCRCGALAGLIARAAIDPLDPVTLLAILKHPYVRLRRDPDDFAAALEALERHALRGARPWTWAALKGKLVERPEALALIEQVEAVFAGLPDGDLPAAEAARALAAVMESLADDGAGLSGDLWSGHGGEAMSRLLAGLIEESEGLPRATPRGFADLLGRLMEGETVRSGGATHSRLRILGGIEARLVRADRLIVAGLEEGVWPKGAPLDPFLSRPMRKDLGLPPPERRVGLAAHDFAQAACAPEVILLHSERREGGPAVKSRWLWRLETLARGAGVTIPGKPEVLDWARTLDAPADYTPARRPAPVPPAADRPTNLFVTRIETLTRDPYSVWARDILKLRQMDRPDEPVEARGRGTAIHKAFERFALAHPADLPADASAIFEGLYLEELESAGMPHEALAREAALAKEAAVWVADLETRRRADGRAIHVEKTGVLQVEIEGRTFTLSAKADRIEEDPEGFGHILDYKTGRAPSQKVVNAGFSPQLTLTAAILAHGDFEDIPRLRPGELTYLEITGRKPAGREEVRATAGDESHEAAKQALAGLKRLVARFWAADQPFVSRTAPQFVHQYASDYDHLARVFEWSTSGEEEGE